MMSPDEAPSAKTKDHENQQQGSGGGSKKTGSSTTRPQEQGLKCPRCDSPNTKFCYYNNYSLTQPRHFCKTCRRYWTKGGALRNVPIGGGCRKNKKVKSSRLSSSCDSRDSGSSSSEFGGLKFLHGLASSSPSLDFHLGGGGGGGLPFPTRLHHHNHNHHPNTALFNTNHFPVLGDLSAANPASCVTSACNNACFNLDPSLIGLNYPFPNSSSPSGFSGGGANNAIMGMSSMNINSNIASSIESLSSMNQDLHWKLQQQRLAMLFSNNGGDNISSHNQKDCGDGDGDGGGGVSSSSHHQVGLIEKPQPILFQNLESSISKPEIFNTRKDHQGPISSGDNNTVTPTEWFFGNNSNYGSVPPPTPGGNSGGGHGHGHDNAAAASNWGGGVGVVHAWGDLQQQYNALP